MEIATLDLPRSGGGGGKPTCAPTFESSPAGPFTYALEYGLWKIFFSAQLTLKFKLQFKFKCI